MTFSRQEKLLIRLTPEAKESFQKNAESLGMTMSTLGSFLIGQFNKQQDQSQVMQAQILKGLESQLLEHMKDGMAFGSEGFIPIDNPSSDSES